MDLVLADCDRECMGAWVLAEAVCIAGASTQELQGSGGKEGRKWQVIMGEEGGLGQRNCAGQGGKVCVGSAVDVSGLSEFLQCAYNCWKTGETLVKDYNSIWESGQLSLPCEYVELKVLLGYMCGMVKCVTDVLLPPLSHTRHIF